MTEDPTAPRGPDNQGSMTTDLVQLSHTKSEKSKVLPSRMVALLHKALLEQSHDEASRKKEYEQGQYDLKEREKNEGNDLRHRSHTDDEDPNVQLAKYIEQVEMKSRRKKAGAKHIPHNPKPAAKHAKHEAAALKENSDKSWSQEVFIVID